ncbi:MAG: hypothetical protein Q4C49_03515 [Bacillota bacterium]|nr:hypothetical protein [Bacillota bacterium]
MKKIVTLLLSICIGFSLCACKKNNKEDVMEFFNAFDKTLELDSGHFSGGVTYLVGKDSNNMQLDLSLIQKGNMELALTLDLEANGNKLEDFIHFYIKDGKTYLNYLGNTSQSMANKIGVNVKKKLNLSNPFLDFTDSELAALFNSVKKEENTYTMSIKPSSIASMLDEFGAITIDSAILVATIEKGYISYLTFELIGKQAFNTEPQKIQISFDGKLDHINSLSKVNFPSDLSTY